MKMLIVFFLNFSDQADISAEIDDEQSTVASDDNATQQLPVDETDKKDIITTTADTSPLSLETISRPISACSTPAPSTATPIASPSSLVDVPKTHEIVELPKLRLNVTLAADPALQPEAKHIKCIRATSDNYDTESICDNEMRDETLSPPILVHDDDGPPEKVRRRDDTPFRSSVANKFVINLQSPNAATVASADIAPRIPAFICTPCNIKFSSMSTLEAHQTFYCTHK